MLLHFCVRLFFTFEAGQAVVLCNVVCSLAVGRDENCVRWNREVFLLAILYVFHVEQFVLCFTFNNLRCMFHVEHGEILFMNLFWFQLFHVEQLKKSIPWLALQLLEFDVVLESDDQRRMVREGI